MFSLFRKKPTFQSNINGTITLAKKYGENAVLTGKITQSGGELVQMWDKLLSEEKKRKTYVSSALLLGVGGGMIFRLIKKYFPKAALSGVEIDPVMIQIAKEYFDLSDGLKATIYEEDAIEWVRRSKKQFDLIAVDLYINEFNASGTREKGFVQGLEKLLNPKGVILYNSHYCRDNPEEYEEFVKMCRRMFAAEEVYKYPLNRILRLVKK